MACDQTNNVIELARVERAPSFQLLMNDVIKSRRSIRRYEMRDVPPALIDELLETAITAPSAHNRQPWRFRVIRCPDEKAKLAKAMGDRLRSDRMADHDPTEAIEADVARSYARMTEAPIIIVVCLSMMDMDRYSDERRNTAEYIMAVQSVAMAGQNLLLAAHASGLGACWVCAPLFCPQLVSDFLELPSDWQPQGMITLGYPAHAGKPFTRKAVKEISA